MKIIHLFLPISLVFLNGCQSLEGITTDKVKKYSSPNELVLKMKLNGSDNKGKYFVYVWNNGNLRDVDSLIPKKSLSLYCESQNGKFERIFSSSMDQVRDLDARNLLRKYKVNEAVGGFRCNLPSNRSWNALIEPLAERPVDSKSYNFRYVKLKTEIMSFSEVAAYYDGIEMKKDIDRAEQKALNEKYEAQERAKLQAKNNFLNANKPTSRNIGSKICKDVTLNFPTNLYVLGQLQYEKTNGVAVGSLEQFSNDGKNIKISLRGWLTNTGGIQASPSVHFDGIPLEAGRNIWENSYGWYLCK
ncbi:hypothetical protein [Acinetobacter indicus]|uniref:hypothetical protein n=1 Tax=Acinetobacter indicus TaxID=756892 RepID=UPI0025761BF5|nr:hypothetical protein [Acinetobacter indicus]MDM1491974.1 hypothetical protein [Acinetobacter indicus]